MSTFNRDWCSVADLEESLERIVSRGHSIVAITPSRLASSSPGVGGSDYTVREYLIIFVKKGALD